MMRPHALTLAAAGALALAACGEATPPQPCTEGSTGDLTVTLSGLPAGPGATVTVTGPGGSFDVVTSGTLPGLATGLYEVSATLAVVSDSLVSTAYAASSLPTSVCVRETGATLTAAYTKVPTSGALWYGAGFYSLGFTTAQLQTTATLAPSVTAGTRGGAGITFDRSGNVWLRGQSASDPAIMRYGASSLAATGNPTPDRSIGVAGLNCVGPGALAFDASSNLWMSIGCQGRVVRIDKGQLTGSSVVSPSVQITGLVNPQGLAFDDDGNLWVADQTHLRRYDAARLSSTITTAANLSVAFTTPTPPAPGVTTLLAFHLAFRPNGELWVSSYEQNVLFRVESATRSATGTVTATPVRLVYLNQFSFPKGFAFDNAGGLWVGTEQSKFVRLSPAQLGTNSTPGAPTVPQRTIASSSILGFGDDIAIFPAAPGTPLYHRVP